MYMDELPSISLLQGASTMNPSDATLYALALRLIGALQYGPPPQDDMQLQVAQVPEGVLQTIPMPEGSRLLGSLTRTLLSRSMGQSTPSGPVRTRPCSTCSAMSCTCTVRISAVASRSAGPAPCCSATGRSARA